MRALRQLDTAKRPGPRHGLEKPQAIANVAQGHGESAPHIANDAECQLFDSSVVHATFSSCSRLELDCSVILGELGRDGGGSGLMGWSDRFGGGRHDAEPAS